MSRHLRHKIWHSLSRLSPSRVEGSTIYHCRPPIPGPVSPPIKQLHTRTTTPIRPPLRLSLDCHPPPPPTPFSHHCIAGSVSSQSASQPVKPAPLQGEDPSQIRKDPIHSKDGLSRIRLAPCTPDCISPQEPGRLYDRGDRRGMRYGTCSGRSGEDTMERSRSGRSRGEDGRFGLASGVYM